MSELDDAAFERAYQRMMFRRNQDALRQEMESLGYEFPEYTSGDYLRDVEAPLIERASQRGKVADDE